MNSFYSNYGLYILAILIVLIAQSKVQSAYHKYKQIKNQKGWTGAQVARSILDANGLQNTQVEVSNSGMLSDHYDPVHHVVRLSNDIYYNSSIAAMSVAAHEVGHAIQHKEKYGAISLRNRLLPAANIASQLGWVILFAGFLMFSSAPVIFYIGIGMLLIVAAFQLVTLPVEINASTRAIKQLEKFQLITENEKPQVKSMLQAAAFTYIAALIATLANVLRFVLLTRNRNSD